MNIAYTCCLRLLDHACMHHYACTQYHCDARRQCNISLRHFGIASMHHHIRFQYKCDANISLRHFGIASCNVDSHGLSSWLKRTSHTSRGVCWHIIMNTMAIHYNMYSSCDVPKIRRMRCQPKQYSQHVPARSLVWSCTPSYDKHIADGSNVHIDCAKRMRQSR